MEQLFAGVSPTVGLSLHAAITGHAVNVLVRGSDVQGPTRFALNANSSGANWPYNVSMDPGELTDA